MRLSDGEIIFTICPAVTMPPNRLYRLSEARATFISGFSRRFDRSLYFRCDLLWVNSPILDCQERPQTSHGQTSWFDDDESALRLARFERSEYTRLSSKSMTASHHSERQADLLNGALLSSRGSIPQAFRLVFKLSLYLLTGPPGRRRLTISCP